MTTFDAAIITVGVALIVHGAWKGIIRQLAFLAALFFGYVAAGRLYGEFAGYLTPYIANREAAFILTYVLLFLVTYLLTIFIGIGLKKVMSVSLLGWFDRLMGGLFGGAQGLFIGTLVFMILSAFLSSSNTYLRNSFTFPLFDQTSQSLLTYIQDKDVREKFKLKEPAIPSFLRNAIPFGKDGG